MLINGSLFNAHACTWVIMHSCCVKKTPKFVLIYLDPIKLHQKQEILGNQAVIPKLVWWLCGGVIFISKAHTNLGTVKVDLRM